MKTRNLCCAAIVASSIVVTAVRASEPFEHWHVDLNHSGVTAVDSQDNMIVGPGTITKIAPDGTVLFQRDPSVDFNLPQHTALRWLAVDSNDNIIQAGKQEGGAMIGVLVVKYDSDGNPLWHSIIGTNLGAGPQPIRVAADEFGDIYVFGETFGGLSGVGPTGNDFLTLKYDSAGTLLWARTAHTSGSDEPFDMDVRDGRVAVTGGAGAGFMTVCYDYAGNELWKNVDTFGLWGAEWVEIGANGQVVICGWGWTGQGLEYAGMVIQYDTSGNQDWKLYHNSPAGPVDNLRRLAVEDNGNVVVAGWSNNILGWSVIKIDPSGTLLWSHYNPGTAVSWEQPNAITIGPGGAIYVAGQLGHTSPLGPIGTVIKYGADGTEQWVFRPSGLYNLLSIGLDSTGAVLVAGSQVAYRIVDPTLTTYCTAKPGLVCGPVAIGFTGSPSAAAPSGFEVFAGPARGAKLGILLYGLNGRAALPFDGGTLCIDPSSLRRSSSISSNGTQGSCDGEFRIDMNAFSQGFLGGNPDPALTQPGTQVDGQWWGRDSIATGAFLSDGIEYTICP